MLRKRPESKEKKTATKYAKEVLRNIPYENNEHLYTHVHTHTMKQTLLRYIFIAIRISRS